MNIDEIVCALRDIAGIWIRTVRLVTVQLMLGPSVPVDAQDVTFMDDGAFVVERICSGAGSEGAKNQCRGDESFPHGFSSARMCLQPAYQSSHLFRTFGYFGIRYAGFPRGVVFHEVLSMRTVVAVLVLIGSGALPVAAQTANPSDDNQTPVATQASIADAAQVSTGDLKKDPAPEHAHTGWATLLKDTGRDFVAFPKRRSTWTLLGLGAAAALATHPADTYVETHIVGNGTADRFFTLGKFAGSAYLQIGSGVGLWAVGRYVIAPATDESKTNKFSEIGFDLMRAQMVSQVIVHGMKYSVRRDRPTGECCAFPSGHAATAFAAASVLERHLGYRASWPALAGAMYVATSRLVDNRHFLSDVMMGAGIGMASGWTVVGTHGRSEFALQPVPVQGGMMIALTRVNN